MLLSSSRGTGKHLCRAYSKRQNTLSSARGRTTKKIPHQRDFFDLKTGSAAISA
jgi:hypothetical protein